MLEAVARRFGAALTIRWHAYELRPEPVPQPDADSDYIQEHWRNRVLPMAAQRGLRMAVPRRRLRSRRALQAALYAREHGPFAELDRALFQARFERDEDIGSIDVLRRLAAEAARAGGRRDDEAAAFAEGAAYAAASNGCLDGLQRDLALGEAVGVRGVPAAFVGPEAPDELAFFAQAEPLAGAVPLEWFVNAIERALVRARPDEPDPGGWRRDF